MESSPVEQKLIKTWRDLVEQFSKRKLTVPADKFPALSGIATEFHKISNNDYHAGLWKSNMTEQLLWHRVCNDPPRSLLPTFRAPSWSWAAVDGAISFSVSASVSSTENASITPQSDKVTIHSCSTTVAALIEPFGKVTTGKLLLSAPARRISWAEVHTRFTIYAEGTPGYLSDYIVLDGGAASPLFGVLHGHGSHNMAQEMSRRVQSFWFLELIRAQGPAGMVLLAHDDGNYLRVAFFRLGSRETIRNQAIEFELGGGARKRMRDWDWEEGLPLRTVTIV